MYNFCIFKKQASLNLGTNRYQIYSYKLNNESEHRICLRNIYSVEG